MCGVVDGGIIAGLWGYEAGQSGVGDIFAWFVDHACRPSTSGAAAERGSTPRAPDRAGGRQRVGEHGLVALDWHSGNRSVLVDHELSGLMLGLTLATRPEDDLPGAARVDRLRHPHASSRPSAEAGVAVEELVIAGGLMRNALLMQIYADVPDLPLSASSPPPRGRRSGRRSTPPWPPAPTRTSAPPREAMGRSSSGVYQPDPDRAAAYDELYAEYRLLHDHFGRGATT